MTGAAALREAIAAGDIEGAAALLASGAPREALDGLDRETLHAIRQRYHRFRRKDAQNGTPSEEARGWANELDERGIIKLSGLIDGEALARMKRDFEAFISSLESRLARGEAVKKHYDEEEHWWPDDQAFVSNNAFKYSNDLVRLCCDQRLVDAANLYLGAQAYIQRGVAMRYLQAPKTRNDMFGWHHDMEERRFKVMVLLTDVGPKDQHMSYILGSHKLFHPFEMFQMNRCRLDYCRERMGELETYKATGVAGDIFLFDTNGSHRGTRRETGRVRDVFLVEYTHSRANIWGADIDMSVFDGIPLTGHNPFEWMLSAEKKWDVPATRTAPSWVETLPNVELW